MRTPTELKTWTVSALLAALTAVCAQLVLPTPWGVPIHLGLLPAFLAGGLLGARDGARSMALYLALGAVGVPVFAGFQGGLGVLAGPTGGYLLAYPAAAALSGRLTGRLHRPFAFACGLALCYVCGALWFAFVTGTPVPTAFVLGVLPYLPADLVKIAAASALCRRLQKVR